ncbi:hypothetical protein CCUS01_16248 [Colletotrichum cuscutae]|uniref:Uncharacterized protein n=1 Tax=Colletotrichum cuscutae TaxID=1209917 RepID=A0AAI9Y6V0_9PEZI|nr:hypothetical protein CCUS01_16248 [Colletotrichum cuscutae]
MPTSRLAIVACAAILIPARLPPPARLAVANSARAYANQVGNPQDLRYHQIPSRDSAPTALDLYLPPSGADMLYATLSSYNKQFCGLDKRQRSLAQHHQQLEAAMLSGKMAKKSPIVDMRLRARRVGHLLDYEIERPGGASRPRAGPGAQAASGIGLA